MSRWEFMRRLEELLSDISPSEREEALQYYNDYFNDAGRENEQEVIDSLGTPEQVAEIVREGLLENGNQGEFTENGFTTGSRSEALRVRDEAPKEHTQKEEEASKKGMPAWAIVLLVIGGICLSPVILGLAFALVGVILSILAALFSVVLGIGIAMVVLYITALALVIGGFGTMLSHPVNGIGMIGGGCICAALGILFMLLLVFLAGKCIPGICQGIGYICKKIFGRKEGIKE